MTFDWVTREEAEMPLGVASRCVVGDVTLETRISQTCFQSWVCGAYDHAPEMRLSAWRFGDIRQAENSCERWALGQVEQIPLLERMGFEITKREG